MRWFVARRAKAVIRYDGPALSEHEMDVHELAPALLALGDLCKVANQIYNGDSATVRVLVKADIEQKCFQLQIELFQSLYESLTTILDGETVKDAKDILEWLGILSGGTIIVGGGLLGLYKTIFGERKHDGTSIQITAEAGSIIYNLGDGAKIEVPPEVHVLFRDPRMLGATKRMLAPLEKDGYERLEFEADGRVTQCFSREEARRIVETSEDAVVFQDGEYLTSKIKTVIRVRKAIFEGNAQWGFMYKRSIEAKMADTEWLSDYQAGLVMLPPRSSLLVDLEERVPVTPDGVETGPAIYTVTKVHGVVPPPDQMKLFKPT